jgi:hypothetical protein
VSAGEVKPLNYICAVPEHCDRITWRNQYYSLESVAHNKTLAASNAALSAANASLLEALKTAAKLLRFEGYTGAAARAEAALAQSKETV